MYTLQTLDLSNLDVNIPECLYFRSRCREAWQYRKNEGVRRITRPSDRCSDLEFSTFFGALSLTTWCGSVGLDEITIEFDLDGACLLRVWQENGMEPRTVLWEGELHGNKGAPVKVALSGLKGRLGVLYPQLEETGTSFTVHSLRYRTDTPPAKDVTLAIIMPTFRREQYVRTNMRLISEGVIAKLGEKRVRLFVVDNGKTLGTTAPRGVKIIPNGNYGGAGGFSRGVIEAMNSPSAFTHVLFCDDDVMMNAESVCRLHALLGYLGNKTIVGGGMINMSDRCRLHELGAHTRSMRITMRKHALDLADVQSLTRYDRVEAMNYFGWWFFSCPMEAFYSEGMPLPVFVRSDDQEFCVRLLSKGWKTATLLGCAVWHEEFHKKDAPIMDYYIARNGLAAAWLREDRFNKWRMLSAIFRMVKDALLSYRYEHAEYLMRGMSDAMKGPEFLMSLDPSEFHAKMSRSQTEIMKPVTHATFVSEKYCPHVSTSRWRGLLVTLTLNGHLLPRWALKNDETVFSPGWAIEHLHSHRFAAIFRKPTVLYCEPTLAQGILCRLDRKRFFQLSAEFLRLAYRMFSNYDSVRRNWREGEGRLTSLSFWRSHLRLEADDQQAAHDVVTRIEAGRERKALQKPAA